MRTIIIIGCLLILGMGLGYYLTPTQTIIEEKICPACVEKVCEKQICKEEIQYINITQECNCTVADCNCPTINRGNITTYDSNSGYILGLIRQVKRCENRETECTNITYSICQDKLADCNETLEGINKSCRN